MTTKNDNPLEGDALLRHLQAKVGPYDGHTHTNVSDGHETLLGLARMASEAGITHLVISDHDYPLHPRKARILSLRCGLDVIPGVELNAVHEVEGHKVLVHLGLPWVPHDDAELNALIQRNQEFPESAYVKAMLQKLYDLGLDPSGQGVERSWQMIQERNPNCKYLGKGVVADLLVETRLVSSRAQAGQRYIGEHGDRLAWVDKTDLFDYVTMEDILRCVGRLNRDRDTAIPVTLNHPFHYGLEPELLEVLVADFARLGGVALEVYYPKHDSGRVDLLSSWCERYGLLPNAGSDYHYDAHRLMAGEAEIFETLRRFHLKKLDSSGRGHPNEWSKQI